MRSSARKPSARRLKGPIWCSYRVGRKPSKHFCARLQARSGDRHQRRRSKAPGAWQCSLQRLLVPAADMHPLDAGWLGLVCSRGHGQHSTSTSGAPTAAERSLAPCSTLWGHPDFDWRCEFSRCWLANLNPVRGHKFTGLKVEGGPWLWHASEGHRLDRLARGRVHNGGLDAHVVPLTAPATSSPSLEAASPPLDDAATFAADFVGIRPSDKALRQPPLAFSTMELA